jgi:hypothetical protein
MIVCLRRGVSFVLMIMVMPYGLSELKLFRFRLDKNVVLITGRENRRGQRCASTATVSPESPHSPNGS